MSTHHQIFIVNNEASSGNLELSDRGKDTFVSGRDKVSWHIHPQSGVSSIRIQKKASSPEIFSSPPHQQGAIWRGDVTSEPAPFTEWVYSIFWKANGSNTEFEFDPKITIRPSI